MPLCKPGANDEIISTQNNHTGPAVDGDVNNGLTKPPASSFTLGGFSIDEPRPMKVVVIGAGYSGKRPPACCLPCDHRAERFAALQG